MDKISILIPCYNAQEFIRPCLESLRWADEIVICDSYSTDRTLEIAREFTDRILQRPYDYSAAQKNWAIPFCKNEWIFIVDSDEVLEEGLREEIMQAVCVAPQEIAGFRMPRKNFVYGKWLRHGGLYPDYQIRLFRKGRGQWCGRRVHEQMNLDGQVGELRHALLHNGFKDISTWFLKTERYLNYELHEYQKRGENGSVGKALVYPLATFFRTFLIERGFLDGFRGLMIATMQSFYHFMIYTKLWERAHEIGKP